MQWLFAQVYSKSAAFGGRVQPGAAVKISTPVSVTTIVSSNWALFFPSRVVAVHCRPGK